MNWLTALLPLALQFVSILPGIAQAWNSATGNSLQKVGAVVQSSGAAALEQQLATIGAQIFPNLAPNLQAAAAALIAAESHTGAVAWVQGALNLAQAAGLVQFTGTGTSGNTPLTVDGLFGPRTQAAILALQAKFGLPTTGMFADTEVSILQAATGGASGPSLQTFLQGILGKL